jgi:hypothetical protein
MIFDYFEKGGIGKVTIGIEAVREFENMLLGAKPSVCPY